MKASSETCLGSWRATRAIVSVKGRQLIFERRERRKQASVMLEA